MFCYFYFALYFRPGAVAIHIIFYIQLSAFRLAGSYLVLSVNKDRRLVFPSDFFHAWYGLGCNTCISVGLYLLFGIGEWCTVLFSLHAHQVLVNTTSSSSFQKEVMRSAGAVSTTTMVRNTFEAHLRYCSLLHSLYLGG